MPQLAASGLGLATQAIPRFWLEREQARRQSGRAVLAVAIAAIGETGECVLRVG